MPIELTPITPPGSYVWRYTSVEAVRTFRGSNAADNDSNGNGQQVANALAYDQAGQFGESDLDTIASGGSVLVPLVAQANSPAAFVINRDATYLVTWWLHRKQPMDKKTTNTFDAYRDEIIARWKSWRDDPSLLPPGFTLNPDGFNPYLNGPGVVGGIWPSVDPQGRPMTTGPESVGAYWDDNAKAWRPGRYYAGGVLG